MNEAVQIQRKYYEQTASKYDDMHLYGGREHYFAMSFLSAMIGYYHINSILDVGAGTGRTLTWLKSTFPDLEVKGVEPVAALREEGHKKGLRRDELVDGDGNNLHYKDGEFDLVCEFGVLHHVPQPAKMVGEMLRVAKKGVFISDSNNFGQGSFLSRMLKQGLDMSGLWPAYNFIRTKGKKYQINEGDGLFYSYSVFNDFDQIKNACEMVHVMNTKNTSYNHYKTAEHVAVLGIKKQ